MDVGTNEIEYIGKIFQRQNYKNVVMRESAEERGRTSQEHLHIFSLVKKCADSDAMN